MRHLTKLLTMMAVLLMPFGMAGASAHSQPHSMMAAMTQTHCPNPTPVHGMAGGLADCAMACAALLPAGQPTQAPAKLFVAEPDRPALALRLHGLRPETEKPPPKLS